MADSIKNRESVSESARHRDDVSPLPWRVENVNQTYHVDAADGGFVTLFVSEADAALVAKAANGRDRLRDLVRRLADNLRRYHILGDRDNALLREAREALDKEAPNGQA